MSCKPKCYVIMNDGHPIEVHGTLDGAAQQLAKFTMDVAKEVASGTSYLRGMPKYYILTANREF